MTSIQYPWCIQYPYPRSISIIQNFSMNLLQTIKCCYQVRVQATSLLKRNTHWSLLGYGYLRENLIDLGGYSTRWMLLICQISFIFILCLYDQGGWLPDGDLAFRSEIGRTKININISGSLSRQKFCKCVSTNLN